MLRKNQQIIIYAQGAFAGTSAKTALGVIKYGITDVVAIVDKSLAGKTADEIYTGLDKIPIFATIEEAKEKYPKTEALIIGIAPPGGRLPKSWLEDMKIALNLNLNLVNGLHDFFTNIPELKKLADEKGLFIWDARKPKDSYELAEGKLTAYPNNVILTVGTDGCVGKKTVSIELHRAAVKKGLASKFIPTGQTGMMISGEGIAIDAIIGDFMAGAIEEEVFKAVSSNHDYIFVEGQGSIIHPAWSSVTLALIHGSLPQKMVLCHKCGLEKLRNTELKIGPIPDLIKMYENVSHPIRKSKVVCIALNTSSLSKDEAKKEIKKLEDETGLVVDDPFRFGADKLLEKCL